MMPPLSRKTKHLLSTVGGPSSSANQSAATALSVPSSSSLVPRPAPLPEGTNIDDDPESSSSSEDGSGDCRSLSMSPPLSPPYQVQIGKKAIKRPHFRYRPGEIATAASGKRARGGDTIASAASTQDSGVGLVESEDMMDMFDDMGASRPAKQRRVTYGASWRSSETVGKAKKTVGHGGKPGAESAHSTPAKNIRAPGKISASSTGRTAAKTDKKVDLTTSPKAMPLSSSKSDTLKQDGPDTPTKRRTLKALPSIDSGASPTLDPKTMATRRSSRRNKSQAEVVENIKDEDHSHDGNIKASSPLGFGDLDDDDDDDNDGRNPNGNYETPAKCPICQAPVDRILLEEWQGSGSYMRIRKQMAFCEAHRRATACEEYAAREYPDIDFDALVGVPSSSPNEKSNGNGNVNGGRIERFRDELVAVVRRERPSAFRDAADAAAAKGEGRNLKTTSEKDKALTGMSVGYYGPRGRRLMEGWVTHELADEIRLQAGRDRLIGFKTVSGFIQEVLVPELAMWLVAEDLDVGEARAREVLRESGEIGELVNGVDEGQDEGEKGADKSSGCVKDEDGGDY